MPSKTEICDLFEILKFIWWPEMTDGWLKIVRKVRSKRFCQQSFFHFPKPKIHDFNLEKHTPQKKVFWGEAFDGPIIVM